MKIGEVNLKVPIGVGAKSGRGLELITQRTVFLGQDHNCIL
jgi:hypothetical protein